MRCVVLLAFLLTAFAPAAQAQGIWMDRIDVQPEGALPPRTEATAFLPVSIDCRAMQRWTGAGLLDDVTLRFVPKPVDGVVFSGPLSVQVPADECATGMGSLEETFPLGFRIAPDAPGQVPLGSPVGVRAEVDAPTDPGEEGVANGTFTIWAAYHGLLDARVSEAVQEGVPGDELRFDVHLENRGNARTRAVLSLAEELEEGWHVELPDPVVMESAAQGGTKTEGTATVWVKGPSTVPGGQGVRLLVTPHSTWDNSTGEPATVDLLAVTSQATVASDVTEESPAPPLLVAVLFALALAARRRVRPLQIRPLRRGARARP